MALQALRLIKRRGGFGVAMWVVAEEAAQRLAVAGHAPAHRKRRCLEAGQVGIAQDHTPADDAVALATERIQICGRGESRTSDRRVGKSNIDGGEVVPGRPVAPLATEAMLGRGHDRVGPPR